MKQNNMDRKHKCCECGNEAKWKLKNTSLGKLHYYCNECLPTLKIKEFDYNHNGFLIKDDEQTSYVTKTDIDLIKSNLIENFPFNVKISINTSFYLTLKYGNCEEKENLVNYNKFMCKIHRLLNSFNEDYNNNEFKSFFIRFKNQLKLKKSYI